MIRENHVCFGFAHLLLNDQRAFRVIGGFGSNMLHPSFPIAAKKVEAQTVKILINFTDQSSPHSGPLRRIKEAFKD